MFPETKLLQRFVVFMRCPEFTDVLFLENHHFLNFSKLPCGFQVTEIMFLFTYLLPFHQREISLLPVEEDSWASTG